MILTATQTGQITVRGDDERPVKDLVVRIAEQLDGFVDVSQLLLVCVPPHATGRATSPPTSVSAAFEMKIRQSFQGLEIRRLTIGLPRVRRLSKTLAVK